MYVIESITYIRKIIDKDDNADQNYVINVFEFI